MSSKQQTDEEQRLSEPLLQPEEEIGEQEEENAALVVVRQHVSMEEVEEETDDDPSSSRHHHHRRRRQALGWAPTTSCWAKVLIPVLILVTHGLFYHGQTAVMWRLTSHYHTQLQYEAQSTETKLALRTVGIARSDEYVLAETEWEIRQFTYAYAIQELWQAKLMSGLFLPRLAAVLLIVFSGIWPHLKLFLLLVTWFLGRNPVRRRRMLACLSVFGKWSLADVLVVCVMVGVLNLQWDFTAQNLYDGVMNNLDLVVDLIRSVYNEEQVCSAALKFGCEHPHNLIHRAKCAACTETVHQFYNHPDYARGILNGIGVSGEGQVQLAVAGLPGIYFFCGAVVLSILLSLIVDWYAEKNRLATEEVRLRTFSTEEEDTSQAPEISGTLSLEEEIIADVALLSPSSTPVVPPQPGTTTALQQLILAENGGTKEFRSEADIDFDRRIMRESQQTGNKILTGACFVTALGVIFATMSTTMERRVHGAAPDLVHKILGVVWAKQYSLLQLGQTTGRAGGWDIMLMSTFLLFLVVGPILRSLLCLAASRLNETNNMSVSEVLMLKRRKENYSFWIDFIGAFCAWEVFTIALVMVDLLMPSITQTIMNFKQCAEFAPESKSCFEMEFYVVRQTYAVVIVSGILLVLVSWRIRNKTYSV